MLLACYYDEYFHCEDFQEISDFNEVNFNYPVEVVREVIHPDFGLVYQRVASSSLFKEHYCL